MIAFLVAALAATLLVALTLPLLRRAVVDLPNHRSSHVIPIPRGGGVAVMGAISVSVAAVAVTGGGFGAAPIVIAALLLATLGLVDDLRSLSGALRLPLQVALLASMVAEAATDRSWSQLEGLAAAGVALFLSVGYVNAFNFMDGINGISGLNAMLAGGWFALIAQARGDDDLFILGAATAGAALGFLPWNLPRARVFLGDVGSYGLGGVLAGCALLAWSDDVPFLLCVAPFAVYVADTGVVLVRRAIGGRPLMQPHREHAYQRAVDAGASHAHSALASVVSSALVCALAWVTDGATMPVRVLAALAAAAVLISYLGMPGILERRLARCASA